MKNENIFKNLTDKELLKTFDEFLQAEKQGCTGETGKFREAIDQMNAQAPGMGIALAQNMLLRECADRWYQTNCGLKNRLCEGDKLWYVDFDEGIIEPCTADGVNYEGNKLLSFGADFGDDYDVFDGSAYGKEFLPSEQLAREALEKYQKNH